MKVVDFYLQGDEPYLTKIVGLTKIESETFVKKGFPILIGKDGASILTSMVTFFTGEIKKLQNHEAILHKDEKLSLRKFKIKLYKTNTNFVRFCEESEIPETYVTLLKKKVKMSQHPDMDCLIFDKKFINFLKQEKTYIDFIEVDEADEIKSRQQPSKKTRYDEEDNSPQNKGLLSGLLSSVTGFWSTPSEPAPSIKNLNDLSSYFGNRDDYIQFRGKYVWEWGWLLFLEKELGAKIVCIWKGSSGDGGIFFDNKNGFVVKSWVSKELERCFFKTKSRFTVGILAIRLDTGKSHANALIFDSENKILTRFEPHGANLETNYDVGELDQQIGKWIKGNMEGWKYTAPIHFCPVRGPQTIESQLYFDSKMKAIYGSDLTKEAGGFCSAWSLLFLHYRLVNPDLSDKEIADYMVSQSGEILFNRIREYVSFIVKNVDPNWTTVEKRILFSVGDNVQFKKAKDKMEYGRIMTIKDDVSVIFSINNLKEKSNDGKFPEYKLYNVKIAQLSMLDEDNDSEFIDEIGRLAKKYATVIKKSQQK